MTRILHMGSMMIDFDRKIKVNETDFVNKPAHESGCLWGSSLIELPDGNITSDWKRFTSWDFTEMDYDFGSSFKLKDDAKILEINTEDEYIKLMEKYKIKPKYHFINKWFLDFERIAKEYDAFHLTRKAYLQMRRLYMGSIHELHYEGFNAYDAESCIIFNLSAIDKNSIIIHNGNIVEPPDEY